MPHNQRQNHPDNSLGSWILVLILLFACWPVGLFLLFKNLMNLSHHPPKRRVLDTTAVPISDLPAERSAAAAPQRNAARPAAGNARTPGKEQKDPLARWGKGLLALGAALSVIFGLSLAGEIGELISGGLRSGMPTDLIVTSGLFATGAVLALCGFLRRKQASRFRKYRALIGRHDALCIDTLAEAMPVSYRKACDDLQDMLNLGFLPAGYVDSAKRQLVFSDRGMKDEPPAPKAETQTPADHDKAILRAIQAINDAVLDEAMSQKIDRIEEVTGKILEFQAQHPESAGELRSFLDYYLPTTLKILRSYAQMEAQGIEGSNISEAKARIEGMMDKIVEGFENRLDRLFQNDALDITSDVAVMEQMLARDGLTREDGLRLES